MAGILGWQTQLMGCLKCLFPTILELKLTAVTIEAIDCLTPLDEVGKPKLCKMEAPTMVLLLTTLTPQPVSGEQ